jgi:lysophospholipase L1-like esterase
MPPRNGRRTRAAAGALAAALALVLALGSCSSGSSSTEPDFGTNDPSVVVALGDSITFGLFDTGIDSCDESLRKKGGFCPRLEAAAGKTVINRGFCGANSYDGVAAIEKVLDRFRPGVILIDYSPNDLVNGTEVTISNLRTMVLAARNHKTVPILGTLVPATGAHAGWMPFIEALNPQILKLCEEEDIECADHFKAFVNDPGFKISPYTLLDGDGLHPNAAGYQLMADTWLRPLLRSY